MRQKTRFKNFGNIGIGLKKAISVDLCFQAASGPQSFDSNFKT